MTDGASRVPDFVRSGQPSVQRIDIRIVGGFFHEALYLYEKSALLLEMRVLEGYLNGTDCFIERSALFRVGGQLIGGVGWVDVIHGIVLLGDLDRSSYAGARSVYCVVV